MQISIKPTLAAAITPNYLAMCCVGAILLCAGQAFAGLEAVITPGASPAASSVWTLSGSGTVLISSPGTVPRLDADSNLNSPSSWAGVDELTAINDFEGVINSGSGTVTLNGTDYAINTSYIDDDTTSGDDFGVGIENGGVDIILANNDAFSWTGTFVTNIPYTVMAPGVYTMNTYGESTAGPTNTTLPLRVEIVPEPGSLALLGLSGLAILRRRRCR